MKTEQEIIELNLKRVLLDLKSIYERLPENAGKYIKNLQITKDNKKVKLNDINFNKDCIFICPYNILGIISYIGMVKINNINLHDTSLSGEKSRVRTSYMITNATAAKYAMFAERQFESEEERDIVNYTKKDLIIWELPKYISTGTEKDERTNINSMLSLYEQRYTARKLNWLFFRGTQEEYAKKYSFPEISNVYLVSFIGETKRTEKSVCEKFSLI